MTPVLDTIEITELQIKESEKQTSLALCSGTAILTIVGFIVYWCLV